MRLLLASFFVSFFAASKFAVAQSEKVWQSFAVGKVIGLMRHAKAPGEKVRPNFRLDDCSTQRNLFNERRDQARRIGAYFRQQGIKDARVYTSQYCRLKETAKLLNVGSVKTNSLLNALEKAARGQAQIAALRRLLQSAATGSATMIVTHSTNIHAITNIWPKSGETILVDRKGSVVERISAQLSAHTSEK